MAGIKHRFRNSSHLDPEVFAQRLLPWYDQHKRALPWRVDRDPYRVWLAEIMLQQTRVAAVLEHYRRFLRRFPDVRKLAEARSASVLAAWSGLGYYRRARMLHAAAKVIVKENAGVLPGSSEGLRELPGIGRYTAAAIASIAYNEPAAVVDGNVERVLQRVLGQRLSGETLWRVAGDMLHRDRPGDFNQAMMELGATVCLPRGPQCLLCPVSELCATRGELHSAEGRPRQNKQEIHFGLARRDGKVLLVQRNKKESLMPGMWELPQLSDIDGKTEELLSLRHSITVTDYTVRVIEMIGLKNASGKWIGRSRLASLPLTGLARKILRRAALM
jgi:A/G-specific adenine glycosylase